MSKGIAIRYSTEASAPSEDFIAEHPSRSVAQSPSATPSESTPRSWVSVRADSRGRDQQTRLPPSRFIRDVALVIVSRLEAISARPNELLPLLRAVHSCLGRSDVVAWDSETSIAVLLRGTDVEAAHAFLRNLRSGGFDRDLRLKVVYVEHFQVLRYDPDSASPKAVVPFASDAGRHSKTEFVLKRLLDIVGSVAGLVLLSPILLAVALAIKATSRGPVLFKQTRIGKNGKPFTFLKLRSMTHDADHKLHREHVKRLIQEDGPKQHNQGQAPWFKIEQDPRVTPIGQFLRKTSIDELPQLFNVLRGDMSLVGPRPAIPYEVELYNDWHLRRLVNVKPGITGLWQADGRGAVTFDDMVRLDLEYVRRASILLDIKIIAKTILVVLKCKGAA